MNTTEVTLVNCLLKRYNLEWTKVGLRYNQKVNYGYIYHPVTRDYKKVLSFIGIDSMPTDIELLYLVICNSKIFNSRPFLALKTCDNTIIQLRKLIIANRPKNAKYGTMSLKTIDDFFGTQLNIKVTAYNAAMSATQNLNRKFNGKLVMHWTDLKPGQILAETIENFKSHVQTKFGMGFLDYLNSSCPSKIKLDFDVYYNPLDYTFELKSELPF